MVMEGFEKMTLEQRPECIEEANHVDLGKSVPSRGNREYSAGLRKNEQPVWLDLSQSKENKGKKLVQKGNYCNPCFVTNAKDGVR